MAQRLHTTEESTPSLSAARTATIRNWIKSEVPTARTELLRETLEHLCALFDAPRALMVWEEPDEPWVNVAFMANPEGLVWKQAAPSSFTPLVADRLAELSFWTGEEEDDEPTINPALRRDFSISSAMSFVLAGEEVNGRIFILDLELGGPEDFEIGELAAAVVEERLGGAMRTDPEESRLVDEKIRTIARDLHDGLLQSFTGIVLQLENLLSSIREDPDEARQIVTELEATLMNEQRELRSYLESLREKKKAEEIAFDMTDRLRDLANRYHDQWGVEVEYSRDSLEPIVREALGWETYRIITEAITNATRHGQAKHVRVTISTSDDLLRIEVEDDGEGFPFRGTFSGTELLETGNAPSSLTERIHSLNGKISIESTDGGSRLDITIPIGWEQS